MHVWVCAHDAAEVPAAKMYLSTATLVVVPDTLIDHWQQQIADHVRPGVLKVCVLADSSRSRSNRSQDLHTYELAWDYDVALTTFSRLSRERGKQRDSMSGAGAKGSSSSGRVEPCLLNVSDGCPCGHGELPPAPQIFPTPFWHPCMVLGAESAIHGLRLIHWASAVFLVAISLKRISLLTGAARCPMSTPDVLSVRSCLCSLPMLLPCGT
jgi:hypothetical protein